MDPIKFLETQGESLGRDVEIPHAQYTNNAQIRIAGFAGGYIPINTTKILKIIPQLSGDIDQPITIYSLRGDVDIFPNKVLFL